MKIRIMYEVTYREIMKDQKEVDFYETELTDVELCRILKTVVSRKQSDISKVSDVMDIADRIENEIRDCYAYPPDLQTKENLTVQYAALDDAAGKVRLI